MANAERSYLRTQFRRHPFLAVIFVIGFIILPGTFIISGPWIISKTSLRQKIVPWAVPELKGECSIGTASFGWFSPIQLDDVSLEDSESKPLLTGATVHFDRTLFELLVEGVGGATLTISDAQIHLVADESSTNWERALETLLAQPASKVPVPAITVKLEKGIVNLAFAIRS